MPLYKNVASQKIPVFAWDTANDAPKTGNAAAITAQISKDGGACAATNDTNPTELDATDAPGIYIFDMLQAETNADLVVLFAKSSTADITLEPAIIYTTVTPLDVNVTQWLASAVTKSANNRPDVNIDEISDDLTAPGNLELMFDGTGYAGGSAKLGVDTVAISGDSTAADNCELMFDGTGYAGGSTKLGVDAVAISGDTTAANNAESFFDGTGYAGTNNVIPTVTNLTNAASNGDFTATQKASITAAVFDYVVENSKSFAVMFRIAYAMLVNKVSGGGTDTVTFRDDADTKDRITMTVDANGNRSAVVKDGS